MYIQYIDRIKTSSSKSRPRKVELVSAHKKRWLLWAYNIKTPTKQPYRIDIIFSLVKGLYKITTESIKLILDAEQCDVSSDLIVPILNVQEVSYFSSSTHSR